MAALGVRGDARALLREGQRKGKAIALLRKLLSEARELRHADATRVDLEDDQRVDAHINQAEGGHEL
eukprot:1888282-Prymnesium_polylepis.1